MKKLDGFLFLKRNVRVSIIYKVQKEETVDGVGGDSEIRRSQRKLEVVIAKNLRGNKPE